MSGLLDKKYINFLSTRLTRFHWVRDHVAVCKCTICNDGHNGRGTRMYIYQDHKHGTDLYFVECKNCAYGTSFSNYLKESDPALYDEYKLELFIERHGREPYKFFPKKEEPRPLTVDRLDLAPLPYAIPISSLPDGNICKEYVKGRLIPEEFYKKLFYTINFKKLVSLFVDDEMAKKMPEDQRLVIPFYDEFGQIVMLQGRSLEKESKIRYITIKKNYAVQKAYGLERVDRSRLVTVVEGPLDSLFLPNTLAAADANLLKVKGDRYCFDNQYKNRDIRRHITNAIDAGVKVVLFPKEFIWKDLNDAIIAGVTQAQLMDILNNNTFTGLTAKLKFNEIKGN